MITGPYVQVQGEVASEYLVFEENWDLFFALTQIPLGDPVVIKVQVHQEYIKLIFEKVGHKVVESTEEMDEDDVEIKQEVKDEVKEEVKEEFSD